MNKKPSIMQLASIAGAVAGLMPPTRGEQYRSGPSRMVAPIHTPIDTGGHRRRRSKTREKAANAKKWKGRKG